MDATQLHRHAEDLVLDAERHMAAGRPDEAAQLYLQAGESEAAALQSLPRDRPKTRGTIALSSAVLFRRAGALDRAVRAAHQALGDEAISAEAREELEMLIDEVRSEQVAGLFLLPDEFQWTLRGGKVGFGYARIEMVSRRIEQIQRYAWRVYEMVAGAPARTTQAPDSGVRAAVDLLVGVPTAGSYRFNVRLAAHQMTLDGTDPDPALLSQTFGSVLWAAQDEDAEFAEVVPDPQYRDAFLRILKDLAPDGEQVREVEVRKLDGTTPPVIMTGATRTSLQRRLRRPKQVQDTKERDVVLEDVLRVIDLNRNQLKLGLLGDERIVHVPDGLVIVDQVTGLEDKHVRILAHRDGNRFVFDDIEAM